MTAQKASNDCAPIALFAFKRPQHTKRALEALAKCPEAAQTLVYAFCDGPRSDVEREDTDATRRVIESSAPSFKGLQMIKRDSNAGLFQSITSGVSQVLQAHECVIVLEDDLVVSPHFLTYMNTALDLYSEDKQVASIHGYIYSVGEKLPETFFLRGADCWGWATWSRAWSHFEGNASKLLHQLHAQNLTDEFNLDGAYDYCELLAMQTKGTVSSWAVCWHASAFLKGMLTLYPGRSLVQNIGTDGSGTHCGREDRFDVALQSSKISLVRLPICENKLARQAVAKFLKSLSHPSLKMRLLGVIRRVAHLFMS